MYIGYIGEVTVQIPSVSPKDMLLKPTSLILNDIHVLVVPDASTRYDQDEEDRRTFEAKRARLARAELPKSRETAVPEDEQQYLGWLDTLLLKCFNNVELKVNNIHIRYEDRMSCPSSPLAAGVTLAGFTAMTVDNQGQQTFIANTYKSVVHKVRAGSFRRVLGVLMFLSSSLRLWSRSQSTSIRTRRVSRDYRLTNFERLSTLV